MAHLLKRQVWSSRSGVRVFLTISQVTSLLLVQDDSLSGEAQTSGVLLFVGCSLLVS